MKNLWLAGLLAVSTVAGAQVKPLPNNPYLSQNTTRTYYVSELEACPGVLDLQVGDLWTLTFPEGITNFFLTRAGVVDAKAQDNRLILTGLGSSGTVPLLVLTESSLAPKFVINLQPGRGGQVKDVQILPGRPAKITCPQLNATLSSPAKATPTPFQTPVTAPTAVTTTVSSTNRYRAMSDAPSGTAGAYASDKRGIGVKAQVMNQNVIRFSLTNTLNSTATFKAANLDYGGLQSKDEVLIVVPAGKTVNQTLVMKGDVSSRMLRTNVIRWPGTVKATGESIILSGTVAY